jgi:allophanate hydrolase subunit 2
VSLEVLSVRGIAWVQDGGRRGFAHQGVPVGGAMCPEKLAQANLAVGNAPCAPALELWGQVEVRLVGGPPRRLWDGGQLHPAQPEGVPVLCGVPASGGVRCAAVEGGLDVPWVLGGQGTLPVLGLGGHQGRALRRGDVLPLGPPSGRASVLRSGGELADGPLRFLPHPDARAGQLSAFCAAAFTVSATSDRVGTRLEGAAVPQGAARLPSAPMVRGAIQLPPGGQPIVLGPDGPTTGGYPVLGVLIRADQGRLGALPVGAQVRFAPVDLACARELFQRAIR